MDWEAFYNSFRQPDFVPGYTIEHRLGGGAFGDVYKARKTSIGKAYAIKFLKVDDEDQRAAVERELSLVSSFASIDHPNLVTIEDQGAAMGVPYLIMGYAGEETLARRLKEGRLTLPEALRHVTQAARGLVALHERRIVHFDLKPSNIFIRGDNARLGDYGLSKLLEGGRMTLTFGRGTPLYMAPEMLVQRADHRADIYSLGVILYESLVGKVPFQGGEGGAFVVRKSDEPPEFPDSFPSVALEATRACLRLDPDDRPESVREVLTMLGQSALAGDDITFEVPRLTVGTGSASPKSAKPERLALSLLDGGYAVEEPTDGPAGSGSSEAAVGRGPASRARALVAELAAESREQRADGEAPSLDETSAASVPVVIPVPPRVTGGLAGTLAETNRVAFDVFVGSVVAVMGGVLAGYRSISDQLVRSRQGGWIGRSFRFALFLLLMATIGFGATLLGLLGINAVEQLGWGS
jgi:serine/threonine protein kinase